MWRKHRRNSWREQQSDLFKSVQLVSTSSHSKRQTEGTGFTAALIAPWGSLSLSFVTLRDRLAWNSFEIINKSPYHHRSFYLEYQKHSDVTFIVSFYREGDLLTTTLYCCANREVGYVNESFNKAFLLSRDIFFSTSIRKLMCVATRCAFHRQLLFTYDFLTTPSTEWIIHNETLLNNRR